MNTALKESTVILAGSRLNALCLSIPNEHVNIFSENLTSSESEIRMSTNSHFSFICCCCFFFCWTNSLRGLRAWIKSLMSIFKQWYAEKLSRFFQFIPKYSSLFSIDKVATRALFLELSGLESGKIVNTRSLSNASEWQKGLHVFVFCLTLLTGD